MMLEQKKDLISSSLSSSIGNIPHSEQSLVQGRLLKRRQGDIDGFGRLVVCTAGWTKGGGEVLSLREEEDGASLFNQLDRHGRSPLKK